MKENKIQKKILNFLNKQEDLINLKELSKQLSISYPSILKHSDILEAKGKVTIKKYGNMKLIKCKN